MSTTTTTTRDRGDRYGPIEWAQSRLQTIYDLVLGAPASVLGNLVDDCVPVRACFVRACMARRTAICGRQTQTLSFGENEKCIRRQKLRLEISAPSRDGNVCMLYTLNGLLKNHVLDGDT